jgi:hypothetical protein
MVQLDREVAPPLLSVRAEQRRYAPYDPFHATPDPLLWRRVTLETPAGNAVWEQTDYGHPGRLNPWEPRGIAMALTPRLALTRAVAEAVGALLD